ncbi:MAG: ankyrin repeat domain-containing protein [Candidatus Babeliales bacterium]|jgi:hypothetical protein
MIKNITLIFILGSIASNHQALNGMAYQQLDASHPSFSKMPKRFIDALRNNDTIESMRLISDKAVPLNDRLRISSKSSCTPLEIAIFYNNPAVVQFLVKQGADTDYKNAYGYTPLDEALNAYVDLLEEEIKAQKDIFCFCWTIKNIDKIHEDLEKMKSIILFLDQYTTEPTSKERVQPILFMTADKIIEHNTLSQSGD